MTSIYKLSMEYNSTTKCETDIQQIFAIEIKYRRQETPYQNYGLYFTNCDTFHPTY